MGETQAIRVPLSELRTNDEQVLGSIHTRKEKAYRWVKNAGTTSLVARACCLMRVTSVEAGLETRVISPDGAGASTGVIGLAAGMPMTAMGPSGSDTGDHGWVQCKGHAVSTIHQMVTALTVGQIAVGTSALPASAPWGKPYSPTANSAATANLYTRHVTILEPIATTGEATAVSTNVLIHCM
jgi:hypothetical protein